MIRKLLSFVILCIAVILGPYTRVHATELSGTYTIDSSGTATTVNFKNFKSAIAYLTGTGSRTDGGPANTAPYGVTGPVVFMVAPGTYPEQVRITGNIPGASPTNTVIFEGTDRATRIITYAATSATSRHTVNLNNVKYVTFRNLTIRATGDLYGWAVHISSAYSNANRIANCIIDIQSPGALLPATASDFAGVVISGSTFTATTGVKIDSLEIDSNTFNNGNFGIVSAGSGGGNQVANKFRNNKLYNHYRYGIYSDYQDGIVISDNTVVPYSFVTNTIGIAVLNSNSATTVTGIVISGNTVRNFGTNGIWVFNGLNNYTGTPGLIINNMIGGGIKSDASSGIYLFGSNYWNICNNTVNHDIATIAMTNAALSLSGGFNINVVNNIFVESQGGAGLPLYASNVASIDTMDYNVFYRSDTSSGQLISLGASIYNTSNFKGGSGFNPNSVFYHPLFVNNTNLHLFNSCLKGVALPYVNNDIDGNPRGIQPAIGAHEPPLFANNIAVTDIMSPVNPIATGSQDVTVMVQNTGSSLITSFTISYRLNNGTPVSQAWAGFLNPCDTIPVTFSGSNSITLSSVNYLSVYTGLPNSLPDDNMQDDTLKTQFFGVLNGVYTAGAPGDDFANLTDIANALQSRGVSGPVVFLVSPGTYTGQLKINGPIAGADTANTITFDGVDASTRIITADIPSAAAVILNKCNYVHFRNFTIANTNSGNCTGFAFVGSSAFSQGSSNSIKHCVINMSNISSTSVATYGILVTGAANGYTTSDNKIDSLDIDSNTIAGANYGIYASGNIAAYLIPSNANNHHYRIRGNNITTAALGGDLGINMNYVLNGVDISNNTISSENGTGIALYSCLNDFTGNESHRIIGNKIRASQGGLNMQGVSSGINNPSRVYNNEIFLHSMVVALGIYYDNPTPTQVDEIYHNTLVIDSTSSLLIGYGLYYGGSSDSKIKNNIFAYMGSGSAPIYPLFISTGVTGNNLNYNVYYNTANDNLVNRYGNSFDRSNFVGISAGGDTSFNFLPAFTSNDDLHLTSGCPRGIDLTTLIPEDIEGSLRSSSPSIGCYEFLGYLNDMSVTHFLQPSSPVSVGLQDMRVQVINNGSNAVSPFSISYILNGAAPVTQSWTGTLLPCDTTSVLFTLANQVNLINGINTLKVYTSLPNGAPDGNTINDTLTGEFAPPLNGTYIIGPAPSDYLNFTSAVQSLTQRGVNGTVIFDVKTGTYSESVVVPDILGSSPANTITFRSIAAHADSVVLSYTGTELAVLSLSDASYISFRNITFNQTNDVNYASAVFITNNSSFDTLENCKMYAPPFIGNLTAGIYTSVFSGNGMVIKNNLVSGGYSNLLFNLFDVLFSPNNTNFNLQIQQNTLQDAFGVSASFYRSSGLDFFNNTITTSIPNPSFTGIRCSSCDSAINISGNKISGFQGGYGISIETSLSVPGSPGLISNNEIAIGSDPNTVYGIYLSDADNMRVYHNSVNINSTLTSDGYAAYFTGGSNIDIKNNIFCNKGGGYSMYTTSMLSILSDYNNLFTTGSNLVKVNSVNYFNLNSWKLSAQKDQHSVSYNPGFTSNTDLQPDLADSSIWSVNGRAIHMANDSTDINGNARPTTITAGVPDIGAYEFTPLSLPPLATAIPATAAAGNNQVFMFLGDTVAKIHWDISTPDVPSAIAVRQYAGEKPPYIGAADNYMYWYTGIDATGSGFYLYNIDVFYKDLWTGTNPAEQDIQLTKKDSASGWGVIPATLADTSRNMLSATLLNTFALFSGTDQYNPLPVKLLTFNAACFNDDVILTWSTGGEINNKGFMIERSVDGKTFKSVGFVAGKGNTQQTRNYQYTDISPFTSAASTLYYRLKQVDYNETTVLSRIVPVSKLTKSAGLQQVTVFPNPANANIYVRFVSSDVGIANISICDITGKNVLRDMVNFSKGNNEISMNIDKLHKGIYFLILEANGNKQITKLIKQ
jgi:hypothetical protein